MWSNSKLLVVFTLFFFLSGFFLLWFGLDPDSDQIGAEDEKNVVQQTSTFSAQTNGAPKPDRLGIEGERVIEIPKSDDKR